MAAPDVSALVALCNKTYDLAAAGHRARSCEYSERALVSAEALGLGEDCLIVADLRILRAKEALVWNAEARSVPPGTPPAALTDTAIERFVLGLQTLQNRRAAGTLMPDSCRTAEVTWKRQLLEHQQQHNQDLMLSAEELEQTANLVGYEASLRAAAFIGLWPSLHKASAEAAGTRAVFWAMLEDACNLFALHSREAATLVLAQEAEFIQTMHTLMDDGSHLLATDAGCVRVTAAWRSLQSSVGTEYLDSIIANRTRLRDKVQRATAAAAAAPGLRTCALESCDAREQHPRHFKACAACKAVVYCSKEHQTQDWPAHKAACKAARKAAAAAAASGCLADGGAGLSGADVPAPGPL